MVSENRRRSEEERRQLRTAQGIRRTWCLGYFSNFASICHSDGKIHTETWSSPSNTREFIYDGNNNLTEVSDNAGNQVTQIDRYDDTPGLVGRTLYGHDAAGRIESITHKDGALDVLDAFTYTWDNVGRLEEESSTLGPTKNYTYFPDGEIKSDGADTWDWDANANFGTCSCSPR